MGKLQDFVNNVNDFAEAVGQDIAELRTQQGNIIDDSQSSAESTYSSQKIDAGLSSKVDKVAGKQLSDENFTSAEKTKLASLEGSHFKGVFASLSALQTALPTAEAGDYADVDTEGESVKRYVWDSTDEEWIQLGDSEPLTAAQVKTLYESNPDTNAYTDDEKAKLAGIEAGAQANTVTSVAGKTGAVTLVKADVGLSSVQNYGMATQSQAETATASNVYMSPLRTANYVDAQVGDDNPLTIYNTAAGN